MAVLSERSGQLHTIVLDDGGRNTLVPDTIHQLRSALAEHPDARAVVLAGRPGVLTAGLDTGWLDANDGDAVAELLLLLGTMLLELWTDPRPTVCAATGHAIAAGTMLAMACDHAVASDEGWWGCTETRIDFELPRYTIALARANVRHDRLEDLLLPGQRVDAATAVDVGFADELATSAQVLDRARERAEALAGLPLRAYAGTKRRFRQHVADRLRADMRDDVRAVTAHLGGGHRAAQPGAPRPSTP